MYTYTKERYFKNGLGICVKKKNYRSEEPKHLHEFIEIVYILSGSGVHNINGVDYQVGRGSVLFINYHQTHYFKTDTEMELWNILLDPVWISEKLIDVENAFELLTLSSFSQFQEEINTGLALIQFHGTQRHQLENLIQEMYDEYKKKDIGHNTILKAQTNILLSLLFRKMSYGGFATKGRKLDEEFLVFVRKHCSEKLTLESLAKNCFYNSSYFSRMFKECYGMTFSSYMNQCRLEKAMELLVKTSLTAEEISERSGFSGKSAFYRLLKEKTGCTPKEYREKNK